MAFETAPTHHWDYICLAADPKPTTGISRGSTCIEADTGDVYVFYAGTWYKIADGPAA